MPGSQKAIYYLSGPSRDSLERDPRLEIFRKKKIPVLYLYEFADEFVLGGLGEYKEHTIVSADQVSLDDLKDVGDPDATVDEASDDASKDEPAGDISTLVERFKDILGDRVSGVRTSERLVDSPACLVGESDQMSGHMEKVLRLMNKDAELPKRVLELNPKHELIRHLASLVERDRQDSLVRNSCEQIFEGAMLVDGYLTDPHALVSRMNELMAEAARLRAASSSGE